MTDWLRPWTAALLVAGSLAIAPILGTTGAAIYTADACASAGGRHVDVSGCADPASALEPEPAAVDETSEPPPPPPAPDVTACVNAGRHVNVSACG